jgi:hypothetical protein
LAGADRRRIWADRQATASLLRHAHHAGPKIGRPSMRGQKSVAPDSESGDATFFIHVAYCRLSLICRE